MKLTVLLSLSLSASISAFAATEFGGFEFHSSVPKNQSDLLINDLSYIYKNPVTSADGEFLKTAEMDVGAGPNFHNWLLNRAHYILGETFTLDEKSVIAMPFIFPNTPMPSLPTMPATDPEPSTPPAPSSGPVEPKPQPVVVMSNMGSYLYVSGKAEKYSIGVKFDGKAVYVTSPRTGMFQVGRGLFLEQFLLNSKDPKAPANSIFRIGTLAHESRHSDGNGKTTALMHVICPKGHPYEGVPACDTMANGPYTIGALSQRHMLKNCSKCSAVETKGLQAVIADSFGRIMAPAIAARRIAVQDMIMINESLVTTFENLVPNLQQKSMSDAVSGQVQKLKDQIISLHMELDELALMVEGPAPVVDVNPEGTFTTITLPESMKLMQKSLR